jgi:hypothetical protein
MGAGWPFSCKHQWGETMRQRHNNWSDVRHIIAERVSRRGFLLGTGATLGAVAAEGFVRSLWGGAMR